MINKANVNNNEKLTLFLSIYIFDLCLWCFTPLSTIFQLYRESVLLGEETRVHGENHGPVTSH